MAYQLTLSLSAFHPSLMPVALSLVGLEWLHRLRYCAALRDPLRLMRRLSLGLVYGYGGY